MHKHVHNGVLEDVRDDKLAEVDVGKVQRVSHGVSKAHENPAVAGLDLNSILSGSHHAPVQVAVKGRHDAVLNRGADCVKGQLVVRHSLEQGLRGGVHGLRVYGAIEQGEHFFMLDLVVV